ncbi:HEPN domain-containing protein [Sphingobacterium bambusae]|uniref:HEPN domain-containing protein n=1 Tax=Sphingobacterium bambusae TaxID=662858 RepID=A0ABW6B9Q7_9SPHI|nr:HEPN domain-containing protein [Sphingobacterium bambusae]WPL48542.1 hypothetical protein SCB77_21570 [Sphingobacterium bambusae]
MTKSDLIAEKEHIPNIIESAIKMSDPNCPITIYEGTFLLKNNVQELLVSGGIYFGWGGTSGAYFTATLVMDAKSPPSFDTNAIFSIIVDELLFGEGFITTAKMGEHYRLKGIMSAESVFGDRSVAVEKIIFAVPNLRNFHGMPVKKICDNIVQTSRNRLIFDNESYQIILDKNLDYNDALNLLQEKGGFRLLYSGELTSKKKALTLENSKDVFDCLGTFLTFLNGRRTSAMFQQGIFDQETKWFDYTDYIIDPHKEVRSWTVRNSIESHDALWKSFSRLWKNSDDREFLRTAIYWYVEANSGDLFLEGPIIMAQTAIELLYNWYIVEQKKFILGKDAESITAANKLRLLLSQLNISHEVPIAFQSLSKFVAGNKEINDAPEAVVQIRNAIVHSQQEKRKKLSKIDSKTKYQALHLCIWYIEMALLKILGYNGKYSNRCSKEMVLARTVEDVPWRTN